MIQIGEDVRFAHSHIYLHSGARAVLEDAVQIQDTSIYVQPFSEVFIGKGAAVREANVDARNRTTLKIGAKVSFAYSDIDLRNDARAVLEDGGQFEKNFFRMAPFSEAVFGTETDVRETRITVGSGAILNMGSNCKIRNAEIDMKMDAKLSLGMGVTISSLFIGDPSKTFWTIEKQAKLEVGDGGRFQTGICAVASNALLKVGRAFSIDTDYRIVAAKDSVICVGDDCMFSYNIRMRSNDGHSIFDVKTGKNISSSYDIRKARKVVIGNHVWVGERCEIMYNTRIGDGSIIGTMSLVKSKIPNNCIAAGIPAKVIRENVAWCREFGAENMMECVPEEYIQYTGAIDNA